VEKVLVDTGPLVAVLDRSDRHHAACVATLRDIRAPLISVWPVLTEASHLLAPFPQAQDELLGLVLDGALRIESVLETDIGRMRQFMLKYRDLPMDLADAALLSVAERLEVRSVFTTDRRDFSLYRTKSRTRLRLLPRMR